MSNQDLVQKIDAIFEKVNKMEPMVADMLINQKAMDARQRFIETIAGKHETVLDFHTKDLNALGAEVKELRIKQTIRSAAQPGESEKWTSFLEFIVVLPKYWKAIALALSGLIGLLTFVWEMVRRWKI